MDIHVLVCGGVGLHLLVAVSPLIALCLSICPVYLLASAVVPALLGTSHVPCAIENAPQQAFKRCQLQPCRPHRLHSASHACKSGLICGWLLPALCRSAKSCFCLSLADAAAAGFLSSFVSHDQQVRTVPL